MEMGAQTLFHLFPLHRSDFLSWIRSRGNMIISFFMWNLALIKAAIWTNTDVPEMSKLAVLRKQFLDALEAVFSYTGDKIHLGSLPLMSATYEYFRNRHLENVTEFTTEEEALLRQQLPTVFTKLGKECGLSYFIQRQGPEDVFNYAKYRSGCRFLIDDAGKFVPDGLEKDENIEEMIDCFEYREYLLEMGGSDVEYYDYPEEPVPEHEGVPDTHVWWKPLEEIYNPIYYQQSSDIKN